MCVYEKVYEQTATGNYNPIDNVWYVDRNRDEVDRGTSQISFAGFPVSRSDPNLGPVSWVGWFPVDEGGRCRRWIADGRIVEDSVMIDVTGTYAIISA